MIPFLTAADIHAALSYPLLVEALRQAFAAKGEPMPVRQAFDVGTEAAPGHLLTMPAWARGEALGVKLVTVFPRNGEKGLGAVSSLYLLMDGQTGAPKALIDGEALTNRRTAAASALASSFLSRPDSRTLLLVGTGQLAAHLPHAHKAVRPIDRVLVWGRDSAKAEALAEKLAREGFAATAVGDIAQGLEEADIVSCATTSREALVQGALVRPGTHVDLVGAFTPQMRESDDELIARAHVYVDTINGALAEAGDLTQPMASGRFRREDVRGDLHGLASGAVARRSEPEAITVFKSVGAAIEDLTAAMSMFRSS